MKINSIQYVKNLKGKKILIRVDYNVTLGKNNTLGEEDDARIRMSLPTIKFLLKKKSIPVILAHRGRPEGKVVETLRLNPLADRLTHLLKKKVIQLDSCTGYEIENKIKKSKIGDIFILENLRFDPREEKNSDDFSQKLAGLGDMYVNDAFSNSHRKHASMVGITKFLPSYAGLLMEKEIKQLSKSWENPKRPLATIIGGAKISTKLGLIKKFMDVSDFVLVGGALANMILKAKGVSIGKSVIEESMIKKVKEIKLTSTKLHIPLDVITSDSPDSLALPKTKAVGKVLDDEYILDLGPDTIELFSSIIKKSKTIIWNGPMGYVENRHFQKATKKIMEVVLRSRADVIIGGGDSLKMIGHKKMNKNIFLSSGGGAMLEFLEFGMLPAIVPLLLKNNKT
ncbi:MAG: Phosphoglycerate kinase [Parcubacteria group bacterium GW2011_GWA2_38_13]|nr:MAG: Phosphoglycerate kinase [Parcubacteria group bacterium GW2011_GWA2_38_13]